MNEIADLHRTALSWTDGDEVRVRAMVEAYLFGKSIDKAAQLAAEAALARANADSAAAIFEAVQR